MMQLSTDTVYLGHYDIVIKFIVGYSQLFLVRYICFSVVLWYCCYMKL